MKKIITLFTFFLSCLFIQAQNLSIDWQNTIGGSGSDSARSIFPTSDGGCIIAGRSFSDASGDKSEDTIGDFGFEDYWVVKVNASGVIEWENTIGGLQVDIAYSVKEAPDGGYIVGGRSRSPISGDKTEDQIGGTNDINDYWVVKLNAAGVVEWDNTIGGSDEDELWAIEVTNDGGFLLGGWSESNISGDKTEDSRGASDYWIVKIDANGVVQWDKTLGGSNGEDFRSMAQTADGGYIIAGSSSSDISGEKTENNIGEGDYWLVKLDASGNIEWDETIGGTGAEVLSSVEQTLDGGYILGGVSRSDISGDKTENTIGDSGLEDYWIVKIDALGNVEWDNTIGGDHIEFDVFAMAMDNGGYLVAGSTLSGLSGDKDEDNVGASDFWIVALNSGGVIADQETIGGDDTESTFFMDYSIEGNAFFMAGSSISDISGDKTEDSNGGFDYWILKLGNVLGINSEDYVADIHVYPNPVTDELQISVRSGLLNEVLIYSVKGDLVSTIANIGRQDQVIDVSSLQSGIYFARIISEGNTVTKKFIKK